MRELHEILFLSGIRSGLVLYDYSLQALYDIMGLCLSTEGAVKSLMVTVACSNESGSQAHVVRLLCVLDME